ncbi:hypothetical protein PENSPDRAFT_755102 [Peniophora sp. CONT]|nr:hypothetical protein PENSPDRAFT_755102 [Peniophora sp. CONT]
MEYDHDRKSGVSSFYGDRRPSYDALHNPAASNPNFDPSHRPRADSSSSFFNPNSGALPPGAGAGHSAGYNRQSYYDAGRQEPVKGYDDPMSPGGGGDEWDVYADFNNAGPRYSTAFGMGKGDASYRPIDSPQPSSLNKQPYGDAESATGPVELVTVPALGPEWKTSELRDMTSAGKRERNAESRKMYWKEFNRGERGLCGIRWLGKRFIVFFCFGLIIAIGITLAFTIPRVPSFLFNGNKPLQPATGSWNESIPTQFSRSPTNFTFPAFADIQVNTNENYLPLTFSKLDATLYDLTTTKQVAFGRLNKTTVPAKEFTSLQIPLNFTYSAVNSSDQTWTIWHTGCQNKGISTNGTRPAVQFRLVLEMAIQGLIGTKSVSTSVTNANCPIELPMNAS